MVDPITGTVAAEYTYDAFGQITQTGPLQQPFGFTGREFDAESGLYYYRARYYDPALGMFIQSDPIGFAAGDLNIYAYVGNDPANWSDPSGYSQALTQGRLSRTVAGMADSATHTIGSSTITAADAIAAAIGSYMIVLMSGDDPNSETNSSSDSSDETGAPPPPECRPDDNNRFWNWERLKRVVLLALGLGAHDIHGDYSPTNIEDDRPTFQRPRDPRETEDAPGSDKNRNIDDC